MAILTNSPTAGNLALVQSAPRVVGEFQHASQAQSWVLHRVFAADAPYSPTARTLAAALACYINIDHASGRACVYHGLQRLARETGMGLRTVKRAGAELEGRTGKPVLFARARGSAEARTDSQGKQHYKPRQLYIWRLVTQPESFAQSRDAARTARRKATHGERTRLQVARELGRLSEHDYTRAVRALQATGQVPADIAARVTPGARGEP